MKNRNNKMILASCLVIYVLLLVGCKSKDPWIEGLNKYVKSESDIIKKQTPSPEKVDLMEYLPKREHSLAYQYIPDENNEFDEAYYIYREIYVLENSEVYYSEIKDCSSSLAYSIEGKIFYEPRSDMILRQTTTIEYKNDLTMPEGSLSTDIMQLGKIYEDSEYKIISLPDLYTITVPAGTYKDCVGMLNYAEYPDYYDGSLLKSNGVIFFAPDATAVLALFDAEGNGNYRVIYQLVSHEVHEEADLTASTN